MSKLEIVRGGFGHLGMYLNDLRIAGEKPWGGWMIIHTFTIRVDDDRVRDALLALWPEVADLRARAKRAEAKLVAIRAEASAAADACTKAITRGTESDVQDAAALSTSTLDRIVLLVDGDAETEHQS